MKKLIAAIASTLTIGAFAADVPWNGDGEYALGADDTMTFSENATITAASTFTGSGTIIVSGGTLTLNYKITETPFSGFTGAVRIDNGATVDENSSQGFNEDGSYNTSVFGPSAKIIFNGGTLRGFKGQNNSQITGPVVVNADSALQNDRSNSGSGVNLRFRNTVSFTGDKTLTINSGNRWVEFSSGVDFSSFTGRIVLNGNSTQEAAFYGTDYGEGATWTFNANRDFRIAPGAGNTVKFGAIDAQNGRIKLDDNNVTLEVGNKTDSSISIPFTNKAFTLKKVGADTSLVLGSEATLLAGSSLNVEAGTLEIDGQDLSALTVTFAADSTLKLDSTSAATIGTEFGKLAFEQGAKLSFSASGLASGEHTLFTYNNASPIATISDVVKVTGVSANASVELTDDNGTVKATIAIPTLVWNGEQTNWTDANAWTVGETKCTYAEGDKVSFTDGAEVSLSDEVIPGEVSVSGNVTIAGANGAKITADSITNGGTLTIAGDVTLDAQITGNVCVAADSTLTFVSGQAIENLKFTGSGKVKFNTSDTMNFTYANLYANGVFADFAGTLELTGGAKLNNTVNFNNSDAVIFPSTMLLRLNTGTITEGATSVNITIHSDIEIVGGERPEDNTIFSKQANFNINGSVRGSGKAWFGTWQRGIRFYGDNRQFSGTMVLHSGDRYNSMGFNDQSCGSSNATWTVENDNYSKYETWGWYTLTFGYDNSVNNSAFNTEEKALHLGAFNVLKPNAILRTYSEPTWLVVGEKNEDCAIEGRFVDVGISDGVNRCNPLHLVKKGTETLTLGTNVVVMAGSTVRVDAGTLAVNSTNLNAAVAVESGATLAGTGTVSSVTFAGGAKIGFDFSSMSGSPEVGDTIDGIVVGEWSGERPVIANAIASSKGTWKLRTKSVADGTQFYAEFAKKGLVIGFR